MLRACWGERRLAALRALAARRGLELVEHGRLAVAGDALTVARQDELCAVFSGRLAGSEPAGAARTIVEAFAREGLAALARQHGAYVVLVSDGRSAWAVRDRLGACTISYCSLGADVVLGEHDADVLELLASTPAPDRTAVVRWIDRRSLAAGGSLFSGLRRLRTGQALELGVGAAVERTYWQPVYRGVSAGPRSELAGALREEAFAAVARAGEHSRAPAVQLSGGLDSACVGAGLARLSASPARALANTFPADADVDESPLIEASARFSGLALTRLEFRDGDLLAPVWRHLERWKVPSPSPNMFIWGPLYGLARELGIDVILDGEGGDEAFGVARYLIADRLRAARLASAWRLCAALPGTGGLPARSRLAVLRAIGVSGALPARVQAARRALRPRTGLVSALVRDADVDALVGADDAGQFKRRSGPIWWRHMVATLLDERDELDINGHLQRVAAEEQLERRHPLMHDAGLIELILRIPPESGFDPNRDRPLLRDALAGHIAEDVRTRYAKSFFTTLSTARMRGLAGDALRSELAHPGAPVREYVDARGLEQLLGPWPSREHAVNVRSQELFTVGVINRWLALLSGR